MEMDRYLAARADRKIKTWPDWFANAKFRDDEVRAGAENWAHVTNTVTPTKSLRLSASQIGRMALLKVMRENGIDAFVHAENTVPTPKIGGANVGTASLDGITPFLQIPRIVVPAGFNRIVYEPTFALNADQDRLRVGAGARDEADAAAQADADCDHVFRRTGRRAGAPQNRVGL